MKRKVKSVWNVNRGPLREQNGKESKLVTSSDYSSLVEPKKKQRKRGAVEKPLSQMKLLELDSFPFSIGVLTLSSSIDSPQSLLTRFESLCANRNLCRVCGSEVKQDSLLCFSCCDVYHHYCASNIGLKVDSVTCNLDEKSKNNSKWLCLYCEPRKLCLGSFSKEIAEKYIRNGLLLKQNYRVSIGETRKKGLQYSHCENGLKDSVENSLIGKVTDENFLENRFCILCGNTVKYSAGLRCSTCNRYVHKNCDNRSSDCCFELSSFGGSYSYSCPPCRQKKTAKLQLGTIKFSKLMEERTLGSLQVSNDGKKVSVAYKNAYCPFFTYVVDRRISVGLRKSVLSKILRLENCTVEELPFVRLPVLLEHRLRVLKHIERLKNRISKELEEGSDSFTTNAKENGNITNVSNETTIPSSIIKGIVERHQGKRTFNSNSNTFQDISLSTLKDYRVCALCKSEQTSLGRLLPIFHYSTCEKIRWVHTQCALFAAETFEDDFGNIHCVISALSRGQRSRCSFCKQHGATVGCCMSRCRRNYHLSCSLCTSGKFVGEKKFYCSKHAKNPKALRESKKSCIVSIEEDPQRCLYIRHEKPSHHLFSKSNSQYACLRVGSFMLILPGYFPAEYATYLHEVDTLFPLGYTSCRYFWSVDHPGRIELYIFHISMNDDKMPLFKIYSCTQITSKSAWPIQGSTPDNVWKQFLSRNPAIQTDLDGKRAFGLSIPAVRFILEHLPEIAECRSYQPSYVELGSRDKDMEPSWNDRPTTCARLEPYRGFRIKTKLETEVKSIITQNGLCLSSTNKNGFSDVRSSDQQLQNYSTSYRRMRRKWRQRCHVRQSGIQGLGLYTSENLPDEELVIEYAGELIRPVVADIREKLYDRRKIGCYMFRLNDDFIVDATMKGNYARFINHSCEPNCRSKIITVDGDKQVIGIFTKRNISAGEELTYDYQFEEFGDTIPCNCGAPNCRGKMN